MLKFLEGYRTYLTVLLIVLHQILKLLGIDVFTDAQLSTFLDVFLAILAAIFKWKADKRWFRKLSVCNDKS